MVEPTAVVVHDLHADHLVVVGQVHAAHAAGDAPHGADILLVEADGLAVLGGQEDILAAVGQGHGDQLVAIVQLDGDDAAAADVGVLDQRGLLDHAVAGGHEQEGVSR